MSTQVKNNTIVGVFCALALLAVSFTAQASVSKVRVCHFTSAESNPTVEIVISDSALQTHLDHGDVVYDEVNGCEEGGGGPSPV